MARGFMDKNFLLENDTAVNLYRACENEPIYDYHCHLSPKEIADNINHKNLAQAWLGADHYKWRMMRVMGFEERLITGDASEYEKFTAWAKTLENLIGNPLYYWTHLELQRYFNIHEPLTEKTAPAIWEKTNAILNTPELSVKGIFEKFKVHTVGTTDDPADSLEYHKAIAEGKAPIGKIDTKVIPAFRPDKALDLFDPDFPDYIEKLSKASGINIKNTDDVVEALGKRLDYFIEHGCRSSDHGLTDIPGAPFLDKEMEKAFKNVLAGKKKGLNKTIADNYRKNMLAELACLYAEKDIVMQLHFNVIRNINVHAYYNCGLTANTGFDAVNDSGISTSLSALISAINLCADGNLPKMIFYSLNPKDYYPITTIMGGFQGESSSNRSGIKGKMQLGSAWWFCDHRDGMEEQMRALASTGSLPLFIGMLTDSRSFLSYPRHEYFRRIMCNLIGKWAENGEFPNDTERLETIVRDISFRNAINYFEKTATGKR